LMTSMKDLFLRALAEMAAKALMTKLTVKTSTEAGTTGTVGGATSMGIAGGMIAAYGYLSTYLDKKRSKENELANTWAQVMGELDNATVTLNAMEQATKDIDARFDSYRATVIKLRGSIESLNILEEKRAEVIEATRKLLAEEFAKPLEDMLAQIQLGPTDYERRELDLWYESQIDYAHSLGSESVDLLRKVLELSKQQLIVKQQEALLGISAEAAEIIETINLSPTELALYNLEKWKSQMSDEVVDVQEEIDKIPPLLANYRTEAAGLQTLYDDAITAIANAESAYMAKIKPFRDLFIQYYGDVWEENWEAWMAARETHGGRLNIPWPEWEPLAYQAAPLWDAWQALQSDMASIIADTPGLLTGIEEAIIFWEAEFDRLTALAGETGSTVVDAYNAQFAALATTFLAGLTDIIREHTLGDYQQGLYELGKWYEEQVAVADALGMGLDLVNQAYVLQVEALKDATLASSDLTDSLETWEDILESLANQILDMRTSLDSPLDALERMALVQEEIAGYGMDYTPADVQKLQDLWSKYLGVAQEAYQRPSTQYQQVFQGVLDALGGLEEYAEEQKSEYEIQLEQLEAQLQMVDLLQGIPSLQHGTSYVPETGLYNLHAGEQVSPAGSSEFNLSIRVDGGASPYATGVAVRQEVEGFLSSNRGRKMVQETSRGR